MSEIYTENASFEEALVQDVISRIRKRMAPEIENLRAELEKRYYAVVNEETATLAVSLSKHISVRTMGEELTITIRKPETK